MIIRTNFPMKTRKFAADHGLSVIYDFHAATATKRDAQIEKKRLQNKGYFVRITKQAHFYEYVIWKRMPNELIHPMDWHSGAMKPRVIGRR